METDVFEAERGRLRAVAMRMLGGPDEADDPAETDSAAAPEEAAESGEPDDDAAAPHVTEAEKAGGRTSSK